MPTKKILITERDEKIMLILKKFGYIREDILATYLGIDYASNNVKDILRVLASRLKKYNIISREKILIGKTFYWWLAKYGAALVEAELIKNISLITVNHNDYVAQIGIDFLVKNPEIELNTEFEIKQTLFGREAKEKKIPDLVINNKIAIEVELFKKNNKKINSIISNYLRSDFDEIIYYCDSKKIADNLCKISNNFNKFTYKIFSNGNILKSENYYPNLEKNIDYLRDNEGKFKNTTEEKIKKLFG